MAASNPIRSWYRGSIASGRTSPLDLIMIQATTFCNIKCKYCYLPFRDKKAQFPLELLPELFAKLRKAHLLDQEVTVLWHAGEPLALPIAYYREAFDLVRAAAPSTRIVHSIQTNGMLIDAEWASFFREMKVAVGLSLDGPERFHDAMRVTRRGDPTLRKALAGLEALRKERVPFSVIAVLTAASLEAPGELYDFFTKIGVRELGLNIDEAEGGYSESSMSAVTRERYVRFLTHFYQLCAKDGHRISVREFTQASQVLQGSMFHSETVSSTENNPLSIINIDVDGNVSTFSPELIGNSAPEYSDFLFGNIQEIEFEELYSHPAFLRLNAAIQRGVENCRKSCSYYSVCGGGAPANKWFENGSFESTETTFCLFKKKYLVDTVTELIHQAMTRRQQNFVDLM